MNAIGITIMALVFGVSFIINLCQHKRIRRINRWNKDLLADGAALERRLDEAESTIEVLRTENRRHRKAAKNRKKDA